MRIRKVLIANRGEIAVRIAQTLQEMGITVVAVYGEPDHQALHVRVADEAYALPGQSVAETYLRGDAILEIARAHGVDAIHPGYGFLSENAAFAQACADAGICFIGPTPQVIQAMGDKIIAKRTMEAAGVPVLPGWSGSLDTDLATIQAEGDAIGYPLLVKAAAGGGGKGMRLVHTAEELPAALEAAAREAQSAFGDARVFLEKYLTRPRHVEFQIFGDAHGNTVHLFERECSIQRRHQKIIEETPCGALTPELRAAMGAAAVKAAQAIGYTNAGTVEFILDEAGNFYFLEVNTRLQVEHPITEMTLHRDLVRAQVAVANGEPLPFTQADLQPTGHAIECRIYAEDPARQFMPAIGPLQTWIPPVGPGIRVDSGVTQGDAVTVHYDPMLAKLIVWGEDRRQALEKMRWALANFPILGVTTNLSLLQAVIAHPAFQAGEIHTHFLQEHPMPLGAPAELPPEVLAALALTPGENARTPASETTLPTHPSPWAAVGPWRNT